MKNWKIWQEKSVKYNERIADLIGQSQIEQEILYALHQEEFLAFEVIGEQGSGKKTLSSHIADSWNKQSKGIVYYLNASYHKTLEDYSTFKNLKMQNSEAQTVVLNIFCESLKDVPCVGNSLSSIANEIVKKTIKEEKLFNSFTQNENHIFSQIYKHAQGNSVLFICNEFELWDLKSQHALSALMEYAKNNNHKTFFIINTVSSLNGLSGANVQKKFLKNITREFLAEIVKQINTNISLNDKQLDSLIELTGGNLELVKECIGLFGKDTLKPGRSFYNIFEERLNNTSDKAKNVLTLLRQTAFIGEIVDSRLLKLYFDIELLNYEDILDESIRLSYLKETDYAISFVQQYIYTILSDINYKDRKYYTHLSKCIRILYPSRYDLQMQYLYRGNLYQEADKMFFLYLISYYRENNMEYPLTLLNRERLSQNMMYSFYLEICKGYKFYKQKRYNEAETVISSLCPHDEAFRFEKDYLYSLIVTNRYYTLEEFNERIDALNVYITDEFKNAYPEMYLRAQMMLIEFFAETNNVADGKKSHQEIIKCFSNYSATDKQMQCYEYCFKMKANVFYKVEIAAKYTRDAYLFFAKEENRQYYISKYFLAILNHSANEIVMGNFENAHKLLHEACEITQSHSALEAVHKDILINNLAISGYYERQFTASECAEVLGKIATDLNETADNLLLKNNQAVFWALEGAFEKAYSASESLYQKISFLDTMDAYYQYFILNNYCVLLWIMEKQETALKILQTMETLQPLPQDNAYFKARYVFLKDLIEKNHPACIITGSNWNRYIINQNPNVIGSAWNFWGSLLLLSELQIWSDY